MKVAIGIDPGKDGYITFWEEESNAFSYQPIPMVGKEVDYQKLSHVFDKYIFGEGYELYAVIENVHAIFGAASKSTFNFGFVAGSMEMMLICYGIPFTKIAPKKWQKQMWEGITLQQKKSSTGKTMVTDTKSMSTLAAKRIFPNEDLRDNNRCRTPHDGKVDSLLICEYCKRNFLK